MEQILFTESLHRIIAIQCRDGQNSMGRSKHSQFYAFVFQSFGSLQDRDSLPEIRSIFNQYSFWPIQIEFNSINQHSGAKISMISIRDFDFFCSFNQEID